MSILPDSNITKKALAAALKELMQKEPFEKISVSEICEQCSMNRKSFYYHFKDKYDLVNWIYDTEFIAVIRQKGSLAGWDLLEYLCRYFYENRSFYRKTLGINGQNSFSDYFREIVALTIANQLSGAFQEDEPLDFYVDFYADAFICAIKRWLTQKDCISAEEFTARLKRCLVGTSTKIVKDFSW